MWCPSSPRLPKQVRHVRRVVPDHPTPTPTGAWRPHPKHSATISPPRTNSRSALQGYPLRFWAPLRSAPSAVRPALLVPASVHQPVPPSFKSGPGPPCTRRRPTSFSQSEHSPFHQSSLCATYVGPCFITPSPPPSPSHHPLHAQDPNP